MKTFFTIALLFIGAFSIAQSGQVKGRVIDQESGEVIAFAKVSLEQNEVMKYATHSDFDGKFVFKNVPAGEYILRIRFIGFDEIEERIIVKPNETSMLDFKMGFTDIPICVCNFYFPEIDLETRNREVGAPPSTE